MTTKHTPGPWYAGEPFEIFPGAGLRFHISQAEGAPYTPHYSDVAQFVAETISSEKLAIQQANARLIAAAPELLAALEDCQTALEWAIEQGGGPACEHEAGVCFCNEKNALNYARAALRKARGET